MMGDAVFYNKRKLCYTEESDFTDFKGIGRDPMYRRYDSIFNIIKCRIDKEYRGFLAQPDYRDGQINWYVDDWKEQPIPFDKLDAAGKSKYAEIKEKTLAHYRQVCSALPTDEMMILTAAIKDVEDQFVYCFDGKVSVVAWGMRPDTSKHAVDGRWVKGIEFTQRHSVIFDSGANGRLELPERRMMTREAGTRLTKKDIPVIIAKEGFKHIGWTPDPIGYEVKESVKFVARYEEEKVPSVPPIIPPAPESEPELPRFAQCLFLPGDHGSIKGGTTVRKQIDSLIDASDIPAVYAHKGYRFTGWDVSPLNAYVNGDLTFTAQYKQVEPWYARWYRSCKWLWWLLLALLLLFLFSWLFKGCDSFGCTSCHRQAILPDDEITAVDTINGKGDNGRIQNIVDDNGNLPAEGVVAPIVDEDGAQPPIEHNEGAPDVVANRLNIYFEEADADLNQWAKDFKDAYPTDGYQIIGYDPNVRMIQIQIPERQRNQLRESLPAKLPNHKFFVVDESIMSLMSVDASSGNRQNRGWHIKATGLEKAWAITKGSEDVVVAVVDDGIEIDHPMLEGRYYKAYNVYTQNRNLSKGEGHGTHVASLAAGSVEYLREGAAGVAPNVKIMPVQVFDNGMCTFSSLASGIMYAVHSGADVVNISVGPKFEGLRQLPLEQQREVARRFFKNEESVFRHIIKTANEKNVILVFAAGNDNVMTAILPECRTAGQTVNVAAVDVNIKATNFTNYSIGTNISAPGENIYSAFPSMSFKSLDGTSMAAPIVAGAIALMRSIKPDLTVGQAIGVLQKTGIPTDGNNRYVPPMLQIDKALSAVKSGDIPNASKEELSTDGCDTVAVGVGNSQRGQDKTYTIIDNETGETVTINSDSDDYNSISSMLKRFLP